MPNKVVNVIDLNAWILANQHDEAIPVPVPNPPPTPPPTPPTPPPPTPPTGGMSSELSKAVSLQRKIGNSGLYGYPWPNWPSVSGSGMKEYPMPGGRTPVWFLIDAQASGFTAGAINILSVGDMTQGGDGLHSMNPIVEIYPIDTACNLVTRIPGNKSTFPVTIPMPNGQGTSGNLISTYRYLVKITCENAGNLWVTYK